VADSPADRPYLHAGFGTPERQNRWSIAFRLILAIPHLIVVIALGIVAYVIVVIGWLAALFMGRLPRWAAEYLRGFILYTTRVYAYFWLMLDRYPPFGWGWGEAYPVNVDVPYGRVRRLAVLFRIILVIPAEIVLGLVSNGLQILLVFIWLIVLVAGRMPVPLFGAIAAVLRFEARFYAYFVMLTGKYPGELFGDSPVAPVLLGPAPIYAAGPVPPGPYGAPSAPGLAPPVPPYPGQVAPPAPPLPAPTAAVPGAMAPPGAVAAPPAVGPPRTARLVLGRGSKALLAAFVVLGTLEYVAIVVVASTASHTNVTAFNSLADAHNSLVAAVGSSQSQLQSCGSNSLSCNETYQGQLAAAFRNFASQLTTISFPSSVQSSVSSLESDTSQLVSVLQQMSAAPDAATYESELSRASSLGTRFDNDYASVANGLL
jgi:hypothetical protein